MAEFRSQKIILLLGDTAAFYLALLLTLILRYETLEIRGFFASHFFPFSILFIFWIFIFIVAGLYENDVLSAGGLFQERLSKTMLAAFALGIALFYAVPTFGIAPKTNLLISVFLSGFIVFGWRKAISRIFANASKIKVLFFGYSSETKEIIKFLKLHQEFGYEPALIVYLNHKEKPAAAIPSFEFNHNLPRLIKENNISLVVALEDIRNQSEFIRFIYEALPTGVGFMDFPIFYERLTGKIPVSLIREIWFLENLAEIQNNVYEAFKRIFDILGAILIFPVFAALFPFIVLAIKFSSSGPIFIRQERVGKNDKIFNFIKFRSMVALNPDGSAETEGPKWAQKKDERIFAFGRFMRKTRLDELPQIFNVLRGDMSFIGPRPERPEFTKELEKQIPHYHMRHLVKPGLSGWAQMNFPYGASVEDAYEKLQYDLYYIKHRSLFLDFMIALRTIAVIFSREGR